MINLRRNTMTKRAAAAKRGVKSPEQLAHIAAIQASEICSLDHAPITVQRSGSGYRCSAVVDGTRMEQYYPSCTLSAAFTAFEQLIKAAR
jgi:hypothetical protein